MRSGVAGQSVVNLDALLAVSSKGAVLILAVHLPAVILPAVSLWSAVIFIVAATADWHAAAAIADLHAMSVLAASNQI